MEWVEVVGGWLVVLVLFVLLVVVLVLLWGAVGLVLWRFLVRPVWGLFGEIQEDLRQRQVPAWKVVGAVGVGVVLCALSVAATSVYDSVTVGVLVGAAPIVVFKVGRSAVRAVVAAGGVST